MLRMTTGAPSEWYHHRREWVWSARPQGPIAVRRHRSYQLNVLVNQGQGFRGVVTAIRQAPELSGVFGLRLKDDESPQWTRAFPAATDTLAAFRLFFIALGGPPDLANIDETRRRPGGRKDQRILRVE